MICTRSLVRLIRRGSGPSDPVDGAFMLSTHPGSGASLFDGYSLTGYDEMFAAPGEPRAHYAALQQRLGHLGAEELEHRHRAADLMMRHQGITFTVYGRDQGVERIIPFDPIPRLVAADEWDRIERGLKQRVRALNLFIHDVYHDRLILRDRAVPAEMVLGASAYRRECVGLRVPKDIYLHISGIDLIRDATGEYLVLEDNGRTPSGVSYVLKNRQVMKQAFPGLFEQYNVRAVDDYASNLLAMLRHIAPPGSDDPTVVVLTPGRLQLGLLRAQLPRPPDGRRAGRGARPVLRRRPDLHEDDPGADAGRRDLPPGRRRLPRPAHLPQGQPARRRRPDRVVPLGPDRPGQRPGDRRGRRQGDLSVRPRDHPLLPPRGPDPGQRRDLPRRRSPRRSSTSWPTSTSWWSRRSTARAATGC